MLLMTIPENNAAERFVRLIHEAQTAELSGERAEEIAL